MFNNWSRNGSSSSSSQSNFYVQYNEDVEEQNQFDEEFSELFEEVQQHSVSIALAQINEASAYRGSVPGRKFRNMNHQQRHMLLMADYFVERPLYSDEDFRRRYRMKRPLFLRILTDCERVNPYFQQRFDAVKRPGYSPILKVTIAMRLLAYAYTADSLDENLRVAETTAAEMVREFCTTILRLYKDEYLRRPNHADLVSRTRKAERRGFPGMIGSLDCMHWSWKNCPTAWQGSFSGRTNKPTIVLEAVVSHDTWIWHAFFGVPGAMNDITVLGRSPLFDELTSGKIPGVEYVVNGNKYHMPYYLADGIYPKWGTLIQSFRNPRTPQQQLFSNFQESYRKDVERAFGILQARFQIVNQPGRGWHTEDLSKIMLCCVILHNMIVEDERNDYNDDDSDDDDTDLRTSRRARAKIYDAGEVDSDNPVRRNQTLDDYMSPHNTIRSTDINGRLQKDLMAHVWARFGSQA